MLKVKCDRCQDEINEPAALVFSPPNENQVLKFHICTLCWQELALFVQGYDVKRIRGSKPLPSLPVYLLPQFSFAKIV